MSVTHCVPKPLAKGNPVNTLQTLLKSNGAFSAGSGALLLLGAPWLDNTFGLEAWLLAFVGVSLLAYGVQIGRLAKPSRAVAGGKLATTMDLGWVVGATVVLVAFPNAMTAAGRIALLLATLVVAGLAAGQATALRKLG